MPVEDPTDGDNRGRAYDPNEHHHFPDERCNEILTFLESDAETQALLEAQNVNAVDRLHYNDHGPTHVSIVRNRALKLYDLLKAGGVSFNGASQQGLAEADEAVIVALAATFHDVGHVVHRDRHTYYSIPIANALLDRILPEFYGVVETAKLKGEVLHAILCHHSTETPLTTEAGVIRIADALDMERGRSRIPYEHGGRGINTISSRAIERVSLKPGTEAPVLIEIEMTDAAGVYQVDSLLKSKVEGSGLEDHLRIVAVKVPGGEEELVERLEL